jgi:hypothetical protein
MSLLPDENIKPSRLNRRRRKKWRVQGLTSITTAVMIHPHSQKTSVEPSTSPNPSLQRPLFNVVFLCPSIKRAALRRLSSVMVGCIGRPLKRSAGSWAGVENPMQSATQFFSKLCGGLSTFPGVTAMVYSQNAPKFQGQPHPKKQARFDLFKYAGGVKTLICRDLPSDQAASLLPELSGVYRLHFTGMMEG